MTTQFVGLKDFRQNLSSYASKLSNGSTRFIILKKNRPLLEVRGLDKEEMVIEKFTADIAHARQQVKSKKVHSQRAIMKEFGLL